MHRSPVRSQVVSKSTKLNQAEQRRLPVARLNTFEPYGVNKDQQALPSGAFSADSAIDFFTKQKARRLESAFSIQSHLEVTPNRLEKSGDAYK
jgi:hypothetical protein